MTDPRLLPDERLAQALEHAEQLDHYKEFAPLLRDHIAALAEQNALLPIRKWQEGMGFVLWWKLPVNEPPWVGTPLCSDWVENYYTHFSRLPQPPMESDDQEWQESLANARQEAYTDGVESEAGHG